ncbi:MAG: hypothetical protein WEA31_08395 [Pirellulales bacterium]
MVAATIVPRHSATAAKDLDFAEICRLAAVAAEQKKFSRPRQQRVEKLFGCSTHITAKILLLPNSLGGHLANRGFVIAYGQMDSDTGDSSKWIA